MTSRRIDLDVKKLMLSNFKTELVGDDMRHLIVKFPGPVGTPYEGGLWDVNVELPPEYPYKSPSVGFKNRIFHPNVEENRGSVCLDVLNRTWTPIFGLVNVFEVFLPQLLSYPNADDPLNREAGRIWRESNLKNTKDYDEHVKKWVAKYALPEHVGESDTDERISEATKEEERDESDSSMSSLDELSDEE